MSEKPPVVFLDAFRVGNSLPDNGGERHWQLAITCLLSRPGFLAILDALNIGLMFEVDWIEPLSRLLVCESGEFQFRNDETIIEETVPTRRNN